MEGHLERDGHTTWYRVVGDLDPDALHAPVVICHGGPGATHAATSIPTRCTRRS
jgi:L-proline amide hydrolase